ncbi:MAG: CBS domain-containing protein [Burkholderiales bacterium]
MADAETLSHAFMRAHPAAAARVLDALPPAEASALLARVPARLAAPVLTAMLPAAAARSLGALEDERALELLGELRTQPMVAILRHVVEPRRSRLVSGLPTTASVAAQLLLGYVEDAVGAWTNPDVLSLPAESRAADALERMRHASLDAQHVFVTGAGGRLEGWVPLPALLRAPPGTSLASILQRPEAVLAARTPLPVAAHHAGWEDASILPVVESGERLVGALTHEALTRAVRRVQRLQRAEPPDTLGGMLARGYWNALSGGAEAMATLLPAVAHVGRKPNER